ncbi:hypothetical protein [Paracoccus tibetensis]|jgi:hypothetical protein|uniref:Uncharacterized protein n=1 Tax=Paracoccus tibetensis TaxID=336292 RepID=A0A1G5ECV8_9RHOB|nr:hypothetical protein [Paracoccus tibetensis]SCY24591.1 hypothetical protein SAMN05660710_01033 [Paracoccus tibetensis]
MTFQRLPASSSVLPLTSDASAVAVPVQPVEADPDVPDVPGLGHNRRRSIKRRTSVTLHLELHEDGEIHIHSPDMPYLILSDRNPRNLIGDVGGALCYEIRRRFSD